jgi:hypothetical protein
MKLDWFEWESYIYLALATVWNGTWEPMGREAKLLVLIDKMLGTQWKFDTASKLDSSQLAGPTRKRHKKWMVCMWPPRWCSVPLLLTGGFQFNLQFPNLSRLCICTYISSLVYISLLFLLYWGAFSSRQDFFFPWLLFVVTTNSRSPELVFSPFIAWTADFDTFRNGTEIDRFPLGPCYSQAVWTGRLICQILSTSGYHLGTLYMFLSTLKPSWRHS